MAKIISILLLTLVLFSCKKDKVPPPCIGVSMSGDRELFIGTWRWYNTIVEQWFDIGPSIYHSYTPQNQNFEYYFTISNNAEFKSYRNDILIDNFILSAVDFENLNGTILNVIRFNTDCSTNELPLYQYSSNTTNDSIFTLKLPLDFDDESNHLRTKLNYFVKE